MGLFDMFSSSPPKLPAPKTGLLATQPAQAQQPDTASLRDKWLAHKQDAMENGTQAMTWAEFQKAQQQPAPQK